MTAASLISSTEVDSDILKEVNFYINQIKDELLALNKKIHENPEVAWEEHQAHDNICNLLQQTGFEVQRHAYGLETAFEARSGSGAKLVNFNAEYDALPGIGHACGHNLIATASIAGFLVTAHVLKKFNLKGRVQCLGTPAEELGGGKIPLLAAGAYREVTASLMVHPAGEGDFGASQRGVIGFAGQKSLAIGDVVATFHGESAHAAAYPWKGVNALDALVAGYTNISMLRQQLHPNERVHGCILEAPKISNAIPELTKMSYSYRSPTLAGLERLGKKVTGCLEAGALATGCKVDLSFKAVYADLIVNHTLCESFQRNLRRFGHRIGLSMETASSGSTDQGNVSHVVPALHAIVGIPSPPEAHPHDHAFSAATGTVEAFERFLDVAKALSLTAIDILSSDNFCQQMSDDFEHQERECKL